MGWIMVLLTTSSDRYQVRPVPTGDELHACVAKAAYKMPSIMGVDPGRIDEHSRVRSSQFVDLLLNGLSVIGHM